MLTNPRILSARCPQFTPECARRGLLQSVTYCSNVTIAFCIFVDMVWYSWSNWFPLLVSSVMTMVWILSWYPLNVVATPWSLLKEADIWSQWVLDDAADMMVVVYRRKEVKNLDWSFSFSHHFLKCLFLLQESMDNDNSNLTWPLHHRCRFVFGFQ